jgi:O-antigen ligase
VVGAAALAGIAASTGDRRAILLPFAGAAGLGLLALALARFELFVAFVLFIRSSLDIAKLGSSSVDITGALSLLFIVGTAAWLIRERHLGRTVEPSPTAPLIPPLATLFGVALLSALVSSHPLESATETVRLGTVLVIVVALGRVLADGRHRRLLYLAALASAIGPLLAAGFQVLTGEGAMVVEGVSRIRGTFQHPNPFAAYLGLVITLAAATWGHVRGRLRVFVVLLAIACAGALVLTYARGAWLGTILALVIVGILQDRRILWALAVGAVVVALFVPSVTTRLSDLSQEVRPSGAPANSLVWRFQYWRQVLAIQRDPILGIGLRGVQLDESVSQLPHNDPIRVYVELGVLGSGAYLWLLATLALRAREALRRARPGLERGLAVAFAAALASIVLQSLAANILTQLVILWYFLAIAALAMAAGAGERGVERAEG